MYPSETCISVTANSSVEKKTITFRLFGSFFFFFSQFSLIFRWIQPIGVHDVHIHRDWSCWAFSTHCHCHSSSEAQVRSRSVPSHIFGKQNSKNESRLGKRGSVCSLTWSPWIFAVLFVYSCPIITTGRRTGERSTESNCTHRRDRWASHCSSYLLLSSHSILLRHSLTFFLDMHLIINPLHFTINLVWCSPSCHHVSWYVVLLAELTNAALQQLTVKWLLDNV